jgi:phosphate transport system permease protein
MRSTSCANTGSSTNDGYCFSGQGVVVSKAPARRDIGIKRRYAAERRFQAYGIAAICFGLIFLFILLWTVVAKGYTAFQQTAITLPIEFSERRSIPNNKRATDPSVLIAANYPVLMRDAMVKTLGVNAASRPEVRDATAMISKGAPIVLRDMVVADPSLIGKTVNVTLLADANVDSANKGQIDLTVDEKNRKVNDRRSAG